MLHAIGSAFSANLIAIIGFAFASLLQFLKKLICVVKLSPWSYGMVDSVPASIGCNTCYICDIFTIGRNAIFARQFFGWLTPLI
jgi:hypothetical protein